MPKSPRRTSDKSPSKPRHLTKSSVEAAAGKMEWWKPPPPTRRPDIYCGGLNIQYLPIAISLYYTFGIGLVQTGRGIDEYQRVGYFYWDIRLDRFAQDWKYGARDTTDLNLHYRYRV